MNLGTLAAEHEMPQPQNVPFIRYALQGHNSRKFKNAV